MKRLMIALFTCAAALLLNGCCSNWKCPYSGKTETIPGKAENAVPAVKGDVLPAVILSSPDGADVDLLAAVKKQPTLLIVYRGGWCPFCTTHLSDLKTVEKDFLQLGYQIIAVSTDRPEKLNVSATKFGVSYQLLSDSKMALAKAMGLAFKLNDDLVVKYKEEYGIDVEADSGETHHLLPVPSAFIVGTDGVIKFAYSNTDYKVRLSGKTLLAKAKALK